MSARDDPPHVTLVLGAGGPVGRAFHAGVLRALVEQCDWNPNSADVIVGTSAGAQIAALLRAGWEARRLQHRPTLVPTPAESRKHLRWPASPEYLRKVAKRPWTARPGPLVAALLPERTGANHGGEGLRRLVAEHWPHRPLWIPAVRADSGARVVFGRRDAPSVDVATAVRCSSAVPGLRGAVSVGAQRYVDGGIVSPTHADLALDAHVAAPRRRTVVILSPLSCYAPMRWLLRHEIRPLVRCGLDVALFEPDRAVAEAMGWNPMDTARAPAVAEAAYRTTRERLQRGGAAAIRLLVGA